MHTLTLSQSSSAVPRATRPTSPSSDRFLSTPRYVGQINNTTVTYLARVRNSSHMLYCHTSCLELSHLKRGKAPYTPHLDGLYSSLPPPHPLSLHSNTPTRMAMHRIISPATLVQTDTPLRTNQGWGMSHSPFWKSDSCGRSLALGSESLEERRRGHR